jgi:hypothetical protein
MIRAIAPGPSTLDSIEYAGEVLFAIFKKKC